VGTRNIEIRRQDGHLLEAYLAEPSRLPAPAVIVLQEIFGVNDFIRGIADRLARSGFIALAPALYGRQRKNVQLDPDNQADMGLALGLLKSFNEALALEDCMAALDYLRASPSCTGKVAAMGYCLGGKLAYLMATQSHLDAAVAYYGTGIHTALDHAPNLQAPLLLHIAGEDFLCPKEAQMQIIDRLAALRDRLKSEASVHVHPGASHGFVRQGKATYQPSVAALADAQTDEFLKKYLRGVGAN
jgi:carboxymethylenebutenolidase